MADNLHYAPRGLYLKLSHSNTPSNKKLQESDEYHVCGRVWKPADVLGVEFSLS
jgi:hypothetical protein